MGVDRLPSGSYRARVMVGGQTRTATFPTEANAADWVVATRGRLIQTRVNRRVTVEQYADRWPGEFTDTAANVDHYRWDVAAHILPMLRTRPPVEVTPIGVEHLVEQLAAGCG
jgi:hypothetical protein